MRQDLHLTISVLPQAGHLNSTYPSVISVPQLLHFFILRHSIWN